jgi:hypothetical protein
MMSKYVVRNLAPNPSAKPMDDRAHEPGALVGREDRDRASGEAHNDEDSHKFAPSIRGGMVKNPA